MSGETTAFAHANEISAAAIRRAGETLRLLSDTSRRLASSLDFEVTLDTVAHLLVPSPAGQVFVAEKGDYDPLDDGLPQSPGG